MKLWKFEALEVMSSIDLRSALIRLAEDWKSGEISAVQVLDKAEDLWETEDTPELPEADPDSIAIEVLSQLSMLNVQLIYEEDIDEILNFLRTLPGNERPAWRRWREYWDDIDYQERSARLSANSLYLTDRLT